MIELIKEFLNLFFLTPFVAQIHTLLNTIANAMQHMGVELSKIISDKFQKGSLRLQFISNFPHSLYLEANPLYNERERSGGRIRIRRRREEYMERVIEFKKNSFLTQILTKKVVVNKKDRMKCRKTRKKSDDFFKMLMFSHASSSSSFRSFIPPQPRFDL
jgi:hypothetical protein